MLQPDLSASLVKDILVYLDCPTQAPTLRYLNRLIYAYICRVPWESVSRIVKRHAVPETKKCPRWPEEFWQDAIRHGFGGTCYESSLAFFGLLVKLGFRGYLTVNDMGAHQGCHAAIVVLLDRQKYLVDITLPIHSAVRFDPQGVTRRQASFKQFRIHPVRTNTYEVKHAHHGNKIAFTLVDVPVDLPEYRTIVENDYGETGRFLNRVVMVKVIDNRTHRFFSDNQPYKLERFSRAGKTEMFLKPEILPYCLATVFEMPEDKISAALTWMQNPPSEPASRYTLPPSVLDRGLP
jgi:arylamine N-acetyltransferase